MTTFTLYNDRTKRRVSTHKTIRGAKISMAAKVRQENARVAQRNASKWAGSEDEVADGFAIMVTSDFENLYNGMVETKNLMTGATVMIRAQDKGGCCDPATETYWSM